MLIGVVGNLGFVGKATTDLLDEKGIKWVGFDLMSSQDIRDKQQFQYWCEHNKPDRILLLAAIARFADADKDPKLAFETNVLGTKNVVDVCKEFHIALIYSSTGSAIMDLQGYESPYKEDIPARGNSPYGCTKAIAEFYVKEHTPHIILRYAHIYGIGKERHGLIGGFYDRIKRGLEPTLFGGLQQNDFTYISDIVQANYLALTAPWSSFNQTYHIGTGVQLTAKEAGDVICKVLGYGGEIDIKPARGVDPADFCFDITKAKTMLGYEPKFTFKQGLEDMIKKGWNAEKEDRTL